MKLVVDMNLSPRWVDLLSAAGFDALHWSSVGAANATDKAIMTYAADNGLVVLSHDLDFGTILAASGARNPSVVTIRADNLDIERLGHPVIAALRQFELDLSKGALLTIHPDRARARLLPLEVRGQ